MLSIILLVWDQLHHTERCVESISSHTDCEYQLIIVDNGSSDDCLEYVRQVADVVIENDRNCGFAAGMNQGLPLAQEQYVAFVNNDTIVPANWASQLLESFCDPRIGMVVPAVTNAGNPLTVRRAAGGEMRVLSPFDAAPSGVVVVMPTELCRELGGWSEEFGLAGAEDADLVYSIWVNGLDVAFDARVLVEHVGKATAAVKLDDWRETWRKSGRLFLDKWAGDSNEGIPRLDRCTEEQWVWNRRVARSAARWMGRYAACRERRLPFKRSLLRVWDRAFLAYRERRMRGPG